MSVRVCHERHKAWLNKHYRWAHPHHSNKAFTLYDSSPLCTPLLPHVSLYLQPLLYYQLCLQDLDLSLLIPIQSLPPTTTSLSTTLSLTLTLTSCLVLFYSKCQLFVFLLVGDSNPWALLSSPFTTKSTL